MLSIFILSRSPRHSCHASQQSFDRVPPQILNSNLKSSFLDARISTVTLKSLVTSPPISPIAASCRGFPAPSRSLPSSHDVTHPITDAQLCVTRRLRLSLPPIHSQRALSLSLRPSPVAVQLLHNGNGFIMPSSFSVPMLVAGMLITVRYLHHPLRCHSPLTSVISLRALATPSGQNGRRVPLCPTLDTCLHI